MPLTKSIIWLMSINGFPVQSDLFEAFKTKFPKKRKTSHKKTKIDKMFASFVSIYLQEKNVLL